jgi:hypothetical protein
MARRLVLAALFAVAALPATAMPAPIGLAAVKKHRAKRSR